MYNEIIAFITNINPSFIISSLLFLIVTLLFLHKKNANNLIKEYIAIVYIIIMWGIFYFINDKLNDIFKLNYLSIKLYLILLIIGNIIMLITINKKISKSYKIINTILFISNMIILVLNILTILGNNYNYLKITTKEECVKLIDINIIIFIIYLNLLCIIYIIKYLVSNIKIKKKYKTKEIEKPNIKAVIDDKELSIISVPPRIKYYNPNENTSFIIDGIDCSIIFEDNNKENIIKNYYILLNNINAKLINGYTLEENIRIKNIINKLNIKDLNDIKLDVNKLNRITIYEYNLLKSYLKNNNYQLNTE